LGDSTAKLVIFDLDETLARKGKRNTLGERLQFAVSKTFGVEVPPLGFAASRGLTDTAALLEIAHGAGISRASAMRRMKIMHREEIAYARAHIKGQVFTPCKGVRPLLTRLRKEGCVLCLATGNLEPVARLKLGKIGLNGFFRFGGFGTTMKRSDLIREAIKIAKKKHGCFSKGDIFYIGDSPRDVEGGRSAGVNTIAVATGAHSMKNLSKSGPDYVLKDLSDTSKVLKIINHR
jgi:phosphoglycolate phosphatase-like HAD superfamily hydrolase